MPSQEIYPFLMFSGNAEEAMNYYISIFEDSEVISIRRYGPNEDGVEGTVLHATFSLKGQHFMCIDSSIQHAFTFTPAISFYVACDSEEKIDRLFAKLSQDGQVLMPLGPYPFSPKFAWVADRYGVSRQLALRA